MSDQSKSNREVIDEIKSLLKTLRRDVDSMRRDISVIKSHQVVNSMTSKIKSPRDVPQEKPKEKIESSGWFWT